MNRPEETLQREVVRYCRTRWADLLVWHTPNGGRRTAAEAGIFRALGVLAGVPDLAAVIAPAGRIEFLELKAAGKKLTDRQIEFALLAEARGARVLVADTFELARAVVDGWGEENRRALRSGYGELVGRVFATEMRGHRKEGRGEKGGM